MSGDAPLVIILTGMPVSGKGEFAIVAEERGCLIKSMGDFIREETERRGLERNAANVGKIANEMRESHGPDIWARCTLEWLDRKGSPPPPVIIIDGCRSLAEFDCFRTGLGDSLRIVAVHVSPDTRFLRMKTRGRADDSTMREIFEDRDRRELGWGIGNVIALADVILTNEGGLEEFRLECRLLLDSWGISGQHL